MRRNLCCCPNSFWASSNQEEMQAALLEGNLKEFTYGNLTNQVHATYDIAYEGAFTSFIDSSILEASIGGWKIHIALPSDLQKVAEAWHRVIFPRLTEYHIKLFKIVKESQLDQTASENVLSGKTVTIYLVHNPELQQGHARHDDLQKMLHEINQGLTRLNIPEVPRDAVDVPVETSPYFSFRCDAHKESGPVEGSFAQFASEYAARLATEYGGPLSNPCEHPDTYNLNNLQLLGNETTNICQVT